jgi:hypothetical protein
MRHVQSESGVCKRPPGVGGWVEGGGAVAPAANSSGAAAVNNGSCFGSFLECEHSALNPVLITHL